MIHTFFQFDVHRDSRGALISLEALKNIPFEIKRIYYIFGVEAGISRGFHAHRKLKQVVICMNGSCRISLDNGTGKESVLLNDRSKGLFIDNTTWREMYDFSEDCVLMVVASEHYSEEDYIRSYQEFKDYVS